MGLMIAASLAKEETVTPPWKTPLSNKLRVSSKEDLIQVFRKYGAAIVPSDVSSQDLERLHNFMLHPGWNELYYSERGYGRWSCNTDGAAQHPAYQPFCFAKNLELVLDTLVADSLVGWQGPHRNWQRSRTCGDLVKPWVLSWQELHSDDNGYDVKSMARGYSLFVSLATQDIPCAFAPLRMLT